MVTTTIRRAARSVRFPAAFEELEIRQLRSATPVAYDGQTVLAESGQWIVAPASKVTETRLDRLLAKVGSSVDSSLGIGGEYLITAPDALSQDALTAALHSLGKKTQIVPNLQISIASTTVNDPSAASQYWIGSSGTGKIDTADAWDISKGDGVVVGEVDTGVDMTHPDLAGKIWTNPNEIPGDGIDNDGDGYVDDVHGWDFANNDNDPTDDNGHGTHVAGLIAASTNNGIGTAGVGYNAQIMPLKFLNAAGSGSLSNAVLALNYAAMMKTKEGVNIRVVSNSWGGASTTTSLQTAFTTLQNAGILAVVAAGNGGTDGIGDDNDTTAEYPANYTNPNIISVAATDASDNLASFSNYGATSVDLGAPGVNDLSTIKGGGYGYMSGTSMATPIVSGAAALLFAAKPNATYADVKAALLNNVDPVASLAGKTVSGGRLNVGKALQAFVGATVTVPTAPASLSATATTTAVSLSWTDSATNETGYKVFRADSSGTYTQIATLAANSTSYSDTAITAGATYTYKVRATNTAGDSADSPVATATVPVALPAAPASISATAGASAITVTWSDTATNETAYKLFRADSSGTYALLATLAANTTTYTDAAVAAGTAYSYKVRATNSAGDSADSAIATATVAIPVTIPNFATNVAASMSGSSVLLTWKDNSTNETGFKIYRNIGPYSTLLAAVAANTTTFTDTTPPAPGTACSYTVFATNSAGNALGFTSNAITIPATAQSLPATATNVSATLSGSSISLTWKDNSTNETGFKVYRNIGPYSTLLTTVPAGSTSYTDLTLPAPGTTCSYTIIATNSVGDALGYTSNAIVIPVTTLSLPASVTNVSATYTNSAVKLTWTDNSTNETGIKVYRNIGPYSTLLATLAPGSTSYTDLTLPAAGTTCSYTIITTNSVGDALGYTSNSIVIPILTLATATTPDQSSAVDAFASVFSATSILFADE